MDKLFLTVLNMSLTGAFVIAVVILARLPLKKAPKIISYCLWAVVGFRLICPFALEGSFSLIPFKAEQVTQDELASEAEITFAEAALYSMQFPGDDTYVPIRNPELVDIDAAPFNGIPMRYLFGYEAYTILLKYLWTIGALLMLLYGIASYALLKRKMRTAIRVEGNLYETDNIQSPFVLGIIKPKIYLPLSLAAGEREYIILHERTHIRRHDHIIKFAAYFILCLHWFNPLVWVAFLLMGADMEMSCDERVLREIGGETKHDYSRSLLSLATQRRVIGGSPLAFSEGGLKQRIKNVLNFRKPSRVIIIAAVVLVAVLSIGFAVNRASEGGLWDRLRPMTMSDLTKYPHFKGVVTEVHDGSVLVLVNEDEDERRSSDLINVPLNVKLKDSTTDLYVGDEILVSYDGMITESYPAGVHNVYGIALLNRTAVAEYTPRKWLDYYNPRGDGPIPQGTQELELPEFPGVTFRWSQGAVTAITADGVQELFTGMPIWNVFLADVTGDGLPEFCATLSMGSGIIDTRILAYDYAGGASYGYSNRMVYDYSLSLEDDRLIVTQKEYIGGDVVAKGTFEFLNGTVSVAGLKDAEQPAVSPEPSPSTTPDTILTPTEIVYQELLDAGCKIEYVFLMAVNDRKTLEGTDNGELATVYASYTEGEYGDAIYCMHYDFERPSKAAQWTHNEPTHWDGIALDIAAYAARTYYSEKHGADYGNLVVTWAGTEEVERLFPDMDMNSIAAFTVGVRGDIPSSIILASPDGQSHWKVIAVEGAVID